MAGSPDEGRQIIRSAHAAARSLRMPYIATEHILLGCLEHPSMLLDDLFDHMGLRRGLLRELVLARAPRGSEAVPDGQLPFAPSAKRVLEASLEEAGRLGHPRIDAGHLILGLVADEQLAGAVLRDAGMDVHSARRAYARLCEPDEDSGEHPDPDDA